MRTLEIFPENPEVLYQNTYYELPKIENSIAKELKTKLTNIQTKAAEDTFGWTVKI